MKNHLDHIRALEAATGESILVGMFVCTVILGVSWLACIAGWWA